ncbi:protein ABHD11 isoform X1 [Ixodes scapularis]
MTLAQHWVNWLRWFVASAVVCYKVYAPDTRNHGDSPHTEGMDYLLMATDLELFCKERGLQEAAILGHSMGGRVAMTFALTQPSMVERLVVVDVAPTFMPPTIESDLLTCVRATRDALKHISPEMSSPAARKEAEKQLGSVIQVHDVVKLLLTNLRKGECSYEWQFNAETLESCARNITQMPELKGLTYDGRVLFICGRNSIWVREEHHGPIRERFPNANIVYVENAGHLVQVDKPAEFLELVTNFLKYDDT